MNQMVNLRLNLKQDELKCENCGAKLSEDEIYVREINGKEHYFCCSHCADKYEARFKEADRSSCC
ncbi:eL24 family ribosomal protein [Saccharolobus islandicus]|uniref:TRASH domain protein n=6 Tax=Saccharolobus TaxID=2100760 RepID=F0NDA6_SACI5|nr:transcriptional regulator [Sulfolobus islandicus]ADX83905.1 TRASH domain protein [Sulfolobus islandicus HVE10/4]ADX86557.1 TRASH domain protein [Sulfolobus islandicus REY15A]PVU77560.1 transcriptional regulator [Sulfolobus islandicus]WCM37402.1 transcriptional regulator [Sulfolobus islandicus]